MKWRWSKIRSVTFKSSLIAYTSTLLTSSSLTSTSLSSSSQTLQLHWHFNFTFLHLHLLLKLQPYLLHLYTLPSSSIIAYTSTLLTSSSLTSSSPTILKGNITRDIQRFSVLVWKRFKNDDASFNQIKTLLIHFISQQE